MKDRYPAVDAFRGGEKVIRIVGHRGARGLIPENTMIGFKQPSLWASTCWNLLWFYVQMGFQS